ncbi:MAG: hypothetical protein AAFP76_04990 [Bacteroidota bacterium]
MRSERIIRFFETEIPKIFRFRLWPTSFRPGWVFITTDIEDFQPQYLHPYLEAVTATQRQAIRTKILRQRWTRQLIGWLALLMSVLILRNTILGTLRYVLSAQTETAINIAKESLEHTKDLDKYFFFVKDGDRWLEEGHYHNAIFQYKKALVVYPSSDAEFKLAQAYGYHCQYHDRDCEVGLELIQKLQQDFPLDKELANIALVFTQEPDDALPRKEQPSTRHIIAVEH